MRSKISITVAIVLACGALSPSPARTAECIVSGYPTTFGVDMNGSFEIRSGDSCHYAFNLRGVVRSSRVAAHAKHGTVRMLDLTSFEYQPRAGYKGTDAFAIEATGESQTGEGKSILNMNVTVN
jgi:hypothetical protein